MVTYHLTGVVMWDATQGTNTALPGNPYKVTVINTSGDVYLKDAVMATAAGPVPPVSGGAGGTGAVPGSFASK
jgi:hypothetical protein